MENVPSTEIGSDWAISTDTAISAGDLRSIDWAAFKDWLQARGLSKKHRASMLNYARKFCSVLFSGRLSAIEGLAGQKHIMMALANLSRFLGCYSFFRKAKEESGLRWKTRNGFDIFQRIYENETEGIEEWVDRVVEIGDEALSFPVLYMALSGLRVVEAIRSLNRIKDCGLDEYYKDSVLEHFKYPKEFFRGNKNAYVTVIPNRLYSALKEWKKHLSYSMLVKRCKKHGLPRRFRGLRKWYATTLRMGGIPAEICNLLEGRVGSSVFVASYLRPDFREDVVKKVKEIIVQYEQKWIR